MTLLMEQQQLWHMHHCCFSPQMAFVFLFNTWIYLLLSRCTLWGFYQTLCDGEGDSLQQGCPSGFELAMLWSLTSQTTLLYIFFILGVSGGVGGSNDKWKHDMGKHYRSVKVEKSFIAFPLFWYANFCTSTGWFSHLIFLWKWAWNQVDVNIHIKNTLTYSYNVTYSFSACYKDNIKNIKNYLSIYEQDFSPESKSLVLTSGTIVCQNNLHSRSAY